MIAPNSDNDWLRDHLEDVRDFIAEGDMVDVLKSARTQILVGVGENFDSAASPDGVPWPPRTRSYPWPILVKTGRMKAAAIGQSGESITNITRREMELGVSSSVFYAGFHNFGTVKLPQREFMGSSEENLSLVDQIIADEIFKAAFGG